MKRYLFASISAIILLYALGCTPRSDQSAELDEAVKHQEHYIVAMKALGAARTEKQRLYALGPAAKESFAMQKIQDADRYAHEMLQSMNRFKDDMYYGQVVHDANFVLGRIALASGNLEEAKKYLLASGNSPGSPELEKKGPNLSLALDLLQKGQKEVVVEYLELCRKFWLTERGRIDLWIQEINKGEIPEFGNNVDL